MESFLSKKFYYEHTLRPGGSALQLMRFDSLHSRFGVADCIAKMGLYDIVIPLPILTKQTAYTLSIHVIFPSDNLILYTR